VKLSAGGKTIEMTGEQFAKAAESLKADRTTTAKKRGKRSAK
jgi:hypothetical protein